MRLVARFLAAVPPVVVTVLMLVAIADMLTGVFLRYVMTEVSAVFNLPSIRFYWVEEIGELCLAWMSFIGAAIGIQLGHSGRKARIARPWEGGKPLAPSHAIDDWDAWELVAPSALPADAQSPVPRALEKSEVRSIVEAWGSATARARTGRRRNRCSCACRSTTAQAGIPRAASRSPRC